MAKRKPRKARPRESCAPGYDSFFEEDLHKTILKDWEAHGTVIHYTIQKKYLPDFIAEVDGKTILIEAKGRFWDSEEYSKYKWAREGIREDQEIVFLFKNPDLPMPRARLRANGTKLSHGEWATKNGFRWFSVETFPEEWQCLTD